MKMKKLVATAIASASLLTLTGCSKPDMVNTLAKLSVKNATVTTTVKYHNETNGFTTDANEYTKDKYAGTSFHTYYNATAGEYSSTTNHYVYVNPNNKNELCYYSKVDEKDATSECKENDEEDKPYSIDTFESIGDILENKDFKKDGNIYRVKDVMKLLDLTEYLLVDLNYDALYEIHATDFEYFRLIIKLDNKHRLSYFDLQAIREDKSITFSYNLKITDYGKTKVAIPTE